MPDSCSGASWENHSYGVDQSCPTCVRLLLQVCRALSIINIMWTEHGGFNVYAYNWSTVSALSAQQLPGNVRLAACSTSAVSSPAW